jgi:hypothetical protein
VQIEKTSKAAAPRRDASEFRDAVAFVHQWAFDGDIRSRMFTASHCRDACPFKPLSLWKGRRIGGAQRWMARYRFRLGCAAAG